MKEKGGKEESKRKNRKGDTTEVKDFYRGHSGEETKEGKRGQQKKGE